MLAFAAAAANVFMLSVVANAGQNSQSSLIELGDPVLVTTEVTRSNETSNILCVDPKNPQKMFGAVTVDGLPDETPAKVMGQNRVPVHLEIHFSADGGKTWSAKFRTNRGRWEGDPACAYGEDGVAFLGTMPLSDDGNFRDYDVWRSPDGGLTWDPKATRILYPRFFDRPFMVVDHSSTPYRGRIYVVGYAKSWPSDTLRAPDQIVLFASDDGGRTFKQPVAVSDGCGDGKDKGAICYTHSGPSTLLSNGTLLTAWTTLFEQLPNSTGLPRGPDQQPGMLQIKVARTRDGGGTFDTPVVAGKGLWRNGPEKYRVPGKWVPAIAADTTKGRYRDHVYVAWSDLRSGRKELWFSSSSDQGKTWIPQRVIGVDKANNASDLNLGPHEYTVSMTVNKDGVIGVFYYTQPTPDGGAVGMFTASRDGGATWSAPQRVIPPQAARAAGNESQPVSEAKDPQQALADANARKLRLPPTCAHGLATDSKGAFHIFAYDYSAGFPELYSAAIHVDP
jgi:hypothetical protein